MQRKNHLAIFTLFLVSLFLISCGELATEKGVYLDRLQPTVTNVTELNAGIRIDFLGVTSASGYKLYYGQSSGTYDGTEALEGESPISLTSDTSITLSGLTNGVTYFIAVSSVVEGEERELSNEVSAVPSVDVSTGGTRVDDEPGELSLTSISVNEIQLPYENSVQLRGENFTDSDVVVIQDGAEESVFETSRESSRLMTFQASEDNPLPIGKDMILFVRRSSGEESRGVVIHVIGEIIGQIAVDAKRDCVEYNRPVPSEPVSATGTYQAKVIDPILPSWKFDDFKLHLQINVTFNRGLPNEARMSVPAKEHVCHVLDEGCLNRFKDAVKHKTVTMEMQKGERIVAIYEDFECGDNSGGVVFELQQVD